MSGQSVLFTLAILSIAMFGVTNAISKREITAKVNKADKDNVQDDFVPVSGPRKFSYQVSDNIKGADQNRQETWDNGTVTGSYVAPSRDGKFLKTEYIADKNGYRIVKTQELTRDEATKDSAGKDSADVKIAQDQQEPISYSVTKEELDQAQKAQKEKAAQTEAA